jgi:hypothetical protein
LNTKSADIRRETAKHSVLGVSRWLAGKIYFLPISKFMKIGSLPNSLPMKTQGGKFWWFGKGWFDLNIHLQTIKK